MRCGNELFAFARDRTVAQPSKGASAQQLPELFKVHKLGMCVSVRVSERACLDESEMQVKYSTLADAIAVAKATRTNPMDERTAASEDVPLTKSYHRINQ